MSSRFNALPYARILNKVLAFCLVFVTGILMPCRQETFAFETEKPSKFENSGFVGWESRLQNVVSVGSGIPQSDQCVSKGGAEVCCSVGKTNLEIVSPIDVSNKASQQNSPGNSVEVSNNKFDHWFLLYVLIAISPLLFARNVASYKPNALRKRAAPSQNQNGEPKP
ncbi:hypothetical protein MTYM_02316 [Methylococcales bacterium]|nr:hypothetical protein MTYM_02316 [Methylococcales bacterium]